MLPNAENGDASLIGGNHKEAIPLNISTPHQRRMTREDLIHNIIITTVILAAATAGAAALIYSTKNTTNIAIVYVLAVMLIARCTDGYVPGIVASAFAVIFVNIVFTYPYMELDFTLEGYPLTFVGMLVIASLTSTLTTHLKEKNRIINEREKLLMEADKEKMRANLLRAISHDLRTPLTSIIGTSSTYLDNWETLQDEEKAALVQTIFDDSNWLLNMVENLLSVTRIRDDNTCVNKTLEPLEEVVSEAVQRFRKRLPDAQVIVSIPEDFIIIPLDATLIEQVIINLLENAYYHGNSPEPTVLTVTVDETDAIFSIKDHGGGIKETYLDTIFDGYTPSANTESDSHKGMGIGLSICKTIIIAHGGTIYAANHEHGAVFTFTLPLGDQTYES